MFHAAACGAARIEDPARTADLSGQARRNYVVEDITGTHADPYHYLIEFHTEFPVNVDVKP